MTSTNSGEAANDELGILTTTEDSAEAFLSRWTKPDETTPSDKPKEGETPAPKTEEVETPDPEKDASEADAEETPADAEDTTPEKKYADDDETYVKIKEGDKEHEVSVKELKRLFGQEASLTRKGQEVAELRKKADTDTAKALTSLQLMTQLAQQRAAPYKQIDFLVAAKELDPQTLNTLRTEAQRALEEERFLTTELDGYVKAVHTEQQARVREDAQTCIKALNDETSPFHVKGWNDALYDGLRSFAVSEGVDKSVINGVTNPAVIKLLHMAMMYKQGLGKAVTTKVNKSAPKKIVKTTSTIQPKSSDDNTAGVKKAMNNLIRKGSVDNAAEALLARWAKTGNE